MPNFDDWIYDLLGCMESIKKHGSIIPDGTLMIPLLSIDYDGNPYALEWAKYWYETLYNLHCY